MTEGETPKCHGKEKKPHLKIMWWDGNVGGRGQSMR